MADFSFIVDINEQNLTEILQQSLEKALVLNSMRRAISLQQNF